MILCFVSLFKSQIELVCPYQLHVHVIACFAKCPLLFSRQVKSKEAETCVLKYPGCSYEECSAAVQDENVEIVFRSFIKKVRKKSYMSM